MYIGDQPTFGQSSSNSREFHGDSSNSSRTSFVFPGPVSNTNHFAASSGPSLFTSNMQGGNQASSSVQSVFSAPPAFGNSTSSTSTASFSTFGYPSFSSAFGQSSRHSSDSHGQASNSSSASFVLPGSFSGSNLFAPSSTSYMQARNQAPSSTRPILSSSPALGSSASFSAFETALFSSGSSFFNNKSGSLFQQTQSSSANQISGSSTVFGPSTQSTFGNNGAPFSSMHKSVTSSSSFTGCPVFSFPTTLTTFQFKKSDDCGSLNSKLLFGQPNSAIGTNRVLGNKSFSSGSSFFNNNIGSLGQQTQTSSANQICGSPTVFGPPSLSTFGNNGATMHDSFTPFSGFTGPAISYPSAPSFTKCKFGKSDRHESLNSQSIFGQQNSVIGINRELGTRSSSSGFCPLATESQCQGSGVTSYVATPEVNDSLTTPISNKIVSISAMLAYENKSQEELRLEDYQLSREKGSSVFNKNPGSLFQQTPSASANYISGSSTAFGPSIQSTFVNNNALVSGEGNSVSRGCKCFESSGSFLTPSFEFKAPVFSSHGTVSKFSGKNGPRNLPSLVSNKEFDPSPIQCQWQGSRVAPYAATPEEFSNVTSATSAKIVSISAMPACKHKSHEELKLEDYMLTRGKGWSIGETHFEADLSTSTKKNLASGSTIGCISGLNNIIFPKIQFPEPSVWMENALSESTLAQNQLDMLGKTSTGLGLEPSNDPLSGTKPAFTSNATSSSIPNQPSADPSAANGSQKTNIQESGALSILTIGRSPVTNPFEGEPTVQISVGCPVSNTTMQYGISSLSVNDNPSTIGRRSLLTVRHLSLNRNRPTVEKYKPERDHKKVPFFEEGLPDACKFKAPFTPRGNPRAWLLRPTEEQYKEKKTNKPSVLEDKSTGTHDTGISDDAIKEKEGGSCPKFNLSLNGSQEANIHIISQGQKCDEEATVYAHVPDVQRIMPKLQHPEYYTIPSIDELAAKEKTEPGFCCHVKDFVVGRYGYGSIKFLGETDVTNLDLESLVQFNCRTVILYMDEIKKPPVGQGLSKPAEITLLNVKCIDKNTGSPQVDGPMVDKYRQDLIKKGAEQGAEFVSYDPASGEWKLRVPHF